jgi:hypothetical protein
MPDWSIKIVAAATNVAGAPAQFVPDLVDAHGGQPLAAQVDDLVTWNNTTGEAHWPWPTDQNYAPLPDSQVSTKNGNYLSDRIPAGMSSRPSYDVKMPTSGSTIYYCCKLHPQERGRITVTAIPPLQPTTS